MAGNQLAKYVWLVDIIRQYKYLTYKQISEKWKNSDFGSGEPLSLRTFHNFRAGIAESLGCACAEIALRNRQSTRIEWVISFFIILRF